MKLVIGYLYPDLMNIYGDTGNIIALKKRAEWRGIEVEIKNISIGDRLKPRDADIFFFGGGQDMAQGLVASDLVKSDKGKMIRQEIERGVPLLSICGGYQLLGDYYGPHEGSKLPGVGLFPAYTIASYDRMIGNIVVESEFGKLVGFENHSGKTHLKKGAHALGKVLQGFGNNGEDALEGCIYNATRYKKRRDEIASDYKNAIGTYMHGSLLPKNPKLADWLLQKALAIKYGKEIQLKPLDDALEEKARQAAMAKFC